MKTFRESLEEIRDADIDYLIARNFYEGREIKEIFSNPNVAALLQSSAKHYHVNIAKRAVDAVLDRLEITAVKVTQGGAESDTVTDAYREHVERPNRLSQTLEDALELAEEYGDAYLMVWPSDRHEGIDVRAYTPLGMRAFYDDQDPMLVTHVVRTWLVPPPPNKERELDGDGKPEPYRRVNWITAEGTQKYISTVPAKAARDEKHFEPYVLDDEPVPGDGEADEEATAQPGWVVNPWEELPVKHLRTRRPYGTPEHYSVYGCQNLLTKEIVTLAESTDGYALPFRWAIKESAQALGAGSDVFGEQDATRTPPRDIPSRAGSLAMLWDVKAVGQLTPADVKNLLDPIDKVMALASTVSTTPLDYFDPSAAAASGLSKKEHKEPLNKKAKRRQRDLGAEIEDALELAMLMLEFADVAVEVVFAPLERVDKSEQYETMEKGQSAGLSFKQAATESGYDGEIIDTEGWRNRREDLAALATFSEALQRLAAAHQLLPNLITPEMLQSAVAALVPAGDDA